MTQFLDARSSQNAALFNSISIPIPVIFTPQLIDLIGLITACSVLLGWDPRVSTDLLFQIEQTCTTPYL